MMGMILLLKHYSENGLPNGLLDMVRNVPDENISKILQTGLTAADNGGYWATRYDFGKGYPGLSPWLIGESRAEDIVINVLLPFAQVWGRENGDMELAERARSIFLHYPASESNTVERHMQRQFGLKSKYINSALRQQGLLHLYKKWCTQGRCGECDAAGEKDSIINRHTSAVG
jgi:hypothetical protein